MSARTEYPTSRQGGDEFEHFLVRPAGEGSRPVVLIFPNFLGLDQFDLDVAGRIAALGYAAFGCDLYGKGRRGTDRESGFALMRPLLDDRALLQDRMLAILATARDLPEVDSARIAAIGFCFGGLCALDLARTGADIRGAASFHGLFTPPGNLDGRPIEAKVIAFHGWADSAVPPEQVVALGEELSGVGADWQIHCFGGAVHGFTHLGDAEGGVRFNALAASRSWRTLEAFLGECFA
jgi:dienelactone hydrolase